MKTTTLMLIACLALAACRSYQSNAADPYSSSASNHKPATRAGVTEASVSVKDGALEI